MRKKLTMIMATVLSFAFLLSGCGTGSNKADDFSVGKNEIRMSDLCKNNIIFRLGDKQINGTDTDGKARLLYFDDKYLYDTRDAIEYDKFWTTKYEDLITICKEKCMYKPDSRRLTEPVNGYVIPRCETYIFTNTDGETFYREELRITKINDTEHTLGSDEAYFASDGANYYDIAMVKTSKMEVEHITINGMNIMKTKEYNQGKAYLCVIDTDATKDITAIVLDAPEEDQ